MARIWYFGAHSLRNLERNILSFIGIKPVRSTLIGMVDAVSDAKRAAWIEKIDLLMSTRSGFVSVKDGPSQGWRAVCLSL